MTAPSARYVMLSDPSHGWLMVSSSDLRAVGLSGRSFSPYSYRRGDAYALEEDCDATIFLQAYRQRVGLEPIIDDQHVNTDAPCRAWQGVHEQARAVR